MKIILLKNYKNLGKRGDLVEVKDGYGRNFLIPHALASLAQENIIHKIKKEINQNLKYKKNQAKEMIQFLQQKIKNKTIKLQLKISQKNQLASPLTKKKLTKLIYNQYKIKFPAASLKLPTFKIKQAGKYELYIFQKKFELRIDKLKK